MREEPDYAHPRWSEVSPHAQDLVKKLLCKDREDRIIVEIVLQHPWLTENMPGLLSKRRNSNDYIETFKAMAATTEPEEKKE